VFLKTIISNRKATRHYLGEEPETMKLEHDEKDILKSVERGEWRSVKGARRERNRYARYADQRLNIRISSKDLEAIQKRALEEDSRTRP
jgi:predicted DNA binding CopG/RHH family protein